MLTKQIGDRKFFINITLRQDELLAPIIFELLKDNPEALRSVSEETLGMLTKIREGQQHVEALTSGDDSRVDLQAIAANIDATQKASISLALDMLKINAWIFARGYARRIMAILLVPEGSQFDESKCKDLENYFGENADRETVNEVISYFFQRSGVFGISTQAFFPKEATK